MNFFWTVFIGVVKTLLFITVCVLFVISPFLLAVNLEDERWLGLYLIVIPVCIAAYIILFVGELQ